MILFKKMLKHKYLLLTPMFLLSACGGVTDQDITRACSKIGNSPNYLASKTFADEYFALEDKAGKKTSTSDMVLGLTLQNIKIGAYLEGGFQRSCIKTFKEDFQS